MKKLLRTAAAMLALAFLPLAFAVPATPGVRDAANMFSADALSKADAKLAAVQRDHGWEIIIETVNSLGGKPAKRLAEDKARSMQIKGVFFLVAKKEHQIGFWFQEPAKVVFDENVCTEATEKLKTAFKKNEFDRGLLAVVDHLSAAASRAAPSAPSGARPGARPQSTPHNPAQPAPVNPHPPAKDGGGAGSFLMTILIIGAVIVGVLFIIRLIVGAANRGMTGQGASGMSGMGGPGYSVMGPGYGGGGGGFFRSLMGGIGGAVLGNWLYDSFSSRGRAYGDETPRGGDGGGQTSSEAGAYDDRGEGGSASWDDAGGDTDGDTGDTGGGDTGGGDFGGGDFGGGDGGGGGGDW